VVPLNLKAGCWWLTAHPRISGPAKEAFKEAVALFDTSFTEDERRRIWLYEKNAMDAVQKVIDNAKARCEEGKRSKARKWLALLSTRVLLYGRVLDVLAQQHPEYVSLVWGAIKFFFIVGRPLPPMSSTVKLTISTNKGSYES